MHALGISKFMNDFKHICIVNSLSVCEGASVVAEMVTLHSAESPEDEKLRHCRTCELLRTEAANRSAKLVQFVRTVGIIG